MELRTGKHMKHMSLSIAGALKNKMFRGFSDDNGRALRAKEVRLMLIDLFNKGHRYMPIGECDNFDPFSEGCRGHVDIPEPKEAK